MERLTWDDIEALADANWHRRDAQGTMLNKVRAQFHAYTVELADAQATVEALQAIIKQMGEQACVLAKDGMAAKAQVEAAERHNTILQDANKVALEKVEALQRELEHAKKMEAVQKEVADNQTWHVQTLRQLVAALPVPRGKVVVHPPCVGMIEGTYDVRIEWQEGNSFKSIRTAQFHVKENAEALAALLTYRATLAAKDARKAVSSG